MRILIAIDGSHYGDAALDYVMKHLTQFGGPPELSLIHVALAAPPRAAGAVGAEILESYYRHEHDTALAPARARLAAAGLQAAEIQVVGSPGRLIAQHATDGRFDLAVMGSHGHGALAGLVMGSTVTTVLAASKVPLLIVR
jgi:nucleotide-binding universal stress UspA family protein